MPAAARRQAMLFLWSLFIGADDAGQPPIGSPDVAFEMGLPASGSRRRSRAIFRSSTAALNQLVVLLADGRIIRTASVRVPSICSTGARDARAVGIDRSVCASQAGRRRSGEPSETRPAFGRGGLGFGPCAGAERRERRSVA